MLETLVERRSLAAISKDLIIMVLGLNTLHVSNDDTYQEIDLYDETAAWSVHYKDHQKC